MGGGKGPDESGSPFREGGGRLTLHWHLAVVPLNMAVGPSQVLVRLLALSLGASVVDIGLISAAGHTATILFSTIWGKLSDLSGKRKVYLVFIIAILGPIFPILAMSKSVHEITILFAVLTIFTSGIGPIAVMFTVESSKRKNWEGEIARYNSISSIGAIFGLLMDSVLIFFIQIREVFYIATILSFSSAILLWLFAAEPSITLERHHFSLRMFREMERLLSPWPLFHNIAVKKFKISKGLVRFRLNLLQLLFLASFIHWAGISMLGTAEIPMLKQLLLSDSQILAFTVSSTIVSIFAFPKVAMLSSRMGHKKLILTGIGVRFILILSFAALSLLLINPKPFILFTFLSSLLLQGTWALGYAMVWLPMSASAISLGPANSKGATQGALNSTIAVANVVGSLLGGFLVATLGYTLALVLAAGVALLAALIISRIDMT